MSVAAPLVPFFHTRTEGKRFQTYCPVFINSSTFVAAFSSFVRKPSRHKTCGRRALTSASLDQYSTRLQHRRIPYRQLPVLEALCLQETPGVGISTHCSASGSLL